MTLCGFRKMIHKINKNKIEGNIYKNKLNAAIKEYVKLKSQFSSREQDWIENVLFNRSYISSLNNSNIYQRRSVRKWIDKKVEDDKIQEIINSALYAPSSCNTQPLDFIIIKDKNIMKKLKDQVFFHYADVCIIVIVDISTHKKSREYFGYLDCGAGVQNMLLTAHDLKLGACWVNTALHETRTDNIKNLLNIPDKYILGSIVALGYPEHIPKCPARKIYKWKIDNYESNIEKIKKDD